MHLLRSGPNFRSAGNLQAFPHIFPTEILADEYMDGAVFLLRLHRYVIYREPDISYRFPVSALPDENILPPADPFPSE